jgi:hypothetical protein
MIRSVPRQSYFDNNASRRGEMHITPKPEPENIQPCAVPLFLLK